MSNFLLIGIGGNKGSGKNTAANTQKFSYLEKIAYADSIKDICSSSFDIDIKYFTNEILKNKLFDSEFIVKEHHIIKFMYIINNYIIKEDIILNIYNGLINKHFESPRFMMQYIGTNIIRKYISDTFFTDIIKSYITNGLHDSINFCENGGIIVTDMRFQNERKLIKDFGGITVLIKKYNKNQDEDLHISEQSLGSESEYDIVIENNGTIEELHENLYTMIQNYLQLA